MNSIQMMGRIINRKFLLLLGSLLLIQVSANATVYTCTNTSTSCVPALPGSVVPGDVLILNSGGTFTFATNLNAAAGGITFQVQGGATVQVNTGVDFIIGSTDLASVSTWQGQGGASWNGLRFVGTTGSRMLRRNNFTNVTTGTALSLNSVGASVTIISRCNITGGANGLSITDSNPIVVFNTIVATAAGGRGINEFDSTGGALPVVAFNNVDGPTDIRFFSNTVGRTFYVENNFTPGGGAILTSVNVGRFIDAAPFLLNDPTTAGLVFGNPIQINAGSYDNAGVVTDLYGSIDGTNTVAHYRFMGAMTFAAGTNLTMGRNPTGTTVGNTYLILPVATQTIPTGVTFQSLGLTGATNTVGGVGVGVGTRGNFDLQAGSTAAFNFSTIRDGGSNLASGTITCTNSQFTGNNVGLDFTGVAAGTVTFTNCDVANNVTNAYKNSVGMISIDNVYWGSTTPNVAFFGGTGIIDFEPWRTGSLGTGILTSSPPTSVNANNPSHNSVVIGSPTAIVFSAQDIGMYNGLPIDYTIEIATDSAFTSIVQRYNPNGRAGVGGNLAAGTFSAAFYASNAPATYNVGTALTPGTYFYRVRGFDLNGSTTLGQPGGQITPVANGLPYTRFTIGNAQVHVTINVNNITKGQSPALNADAGDILEYTVTFRNDGAAAAANATLTNVLPIDVFNLIVASHNVTFSGGAPTVIVSAYSDNAGAVLVAQDNNVQVTGVEQLVNWSTNPLTAAEALLVRRISFNFSSLGANDSGSVRYRVRVR